MKYFVKKNPSGAASEQLSSDLRTILDSINDGVFTVDDHFRITSFNRAAAEILGITPEEAMGRPCWKVFNADICEGSCALKETMATGAPLINKHVNIHTSARRRVSISVSTALLRSPSGDVVGGVESFRDLTVVEELRKAAEGRTTFHHMTSVNHRMREIFKLLPLLAQSDSTVLIQGESGTGKELMARAIHDLSSRARRPLVTLNCGALPDTLLEAELFGHKAGAFTDAKRDRKGRIAAAEGSTLFLDEIGDISPALQVRLLRVLQERTYEPLGSNETVRANVRFIAATHRDLRTEVREGRFREDLFYRLNVMQIAIPPLRERREDIPALARRFLDRQVTLHGRQIQGFSGEAMDRLMRHIWPGNIRELENAVEHACVLCRGDQIQLSELPQALEDVAKAAPAADPAPAGQDLHSREMAAIQAALERHGGNRTAAARELGIHPTTLWRKLRRG
ncbi:Fis family transcriptional regulator [Geothrix rubra]|uniref:Fis family transcriptional regulator n=1 Tax=Geothrix rubra TaxID=2927977 RepID=A0ABQ5Q4Z6_9BACT|nr:sigma 54-interacting transcriptional regulator [Geothrix rubra]GLH69708.1 Fis family transcriptional regulator [Geothrix rubra]